MQAATMSTIVERIIESAHQIKWTTMPDRVFAALDPMSGREVVRVYRNLNRVYVEVSGLRETIYDGDPRGQLLVDAITAAVCTQAMPDIEALIASSGDEHDAVQETEPDQSGDSYQLVWSSKAPVLEITEENPIHYVLTANRYGIYLMSFNGQWRDDDDHLHSEEWVTDAEGFGVQFAVVPPPKNRQ